MGYPPVVVTPDMSTSEMVSRVVELTDVKPSIRKTYRQAASWRDDQRERCGRKRTGSIMR